MNTAINVAHAGPAELLLKCKQIFLRCNLFDYKAWLSKYSSISQDISFIDSCKTSGHIEVSIENTRSSLPLRIWTLFLGHPHGPSHLISTLTNVYLFAIYLTTLSVT